MLRQERNPGVPLVPLEQAVSMTLERKSRGRVPISKDPDVPIHSIYI